MQSNFLDIIIFAAVAAFLVWRLWGMLGKRHGEERQRPPSAHAASRPDTPATDNIVSLPERRVPAEGEQDDGPVSLALMLERLQACDPSFDETAFLGGARAVFEMIIQAYCSGDIDSVRGLMGSGPVSMFEDAIADRASKGWTETITIDAFEAVDIKNIALDGAIARVTVRYITKQSKVIVDGEGNEVPDASAREEETIDAWTFERDTRSSDPNWGLISMDDEL